MPVCTSNAAWERKVTKRHFHHEVSKGLARLQWMKSTRFEFTEAAVGHFISKMDTMSTKFGIKVFRTFVPS